MSAQLDPALVGIDSLIERWARLDRPTRQLHPLEAMRLMRDGAVLGGGSGEVSDDVAAFDRCYCDAPEGKRALVTAIYCRRAPMSTIAGRLGISRSTLYAEWRASLEFFKGAMWAKGYKV